MIWKVAWRKPPRCFVTVTSCRGRTAYPVCDSHIAWRPAPWRIAMGTTTAAERKATERIHRQVMPGATGPNWSTPFVAPVNLPDHLADPDLSVGELTLKFMLQR